MKKVKDWLIKNVVLLGAIVAFTTILLNLGTLTKLFLPSPPPAPQLSAEAIARKVIEKQGDKKVEDLQEQMAQLILTVEDLKNRRTEPDAPPGIDSALKELEDGNTGKAENIFRQVLQDKVKEGKEANREAAEAARHLGALAFLHDTRSALDAYQQAVVLDPENPDGWNQLGHLQIRTGNLDAAIQSYNHVLQIGEAGGQKMLLAVATGNLGIIYQTRGELHKAEEYYKKSLAIEEELGRKEGMANQYGNRGNIYRIRGELEKAEEYYRKSLAINEELGRKEGVANQYGNLGIIYQIRGELEKAEEHYRKALAINEELGRKEGMASQYGNLGIIYKIRGELDKAEEHYKKSLAISEELGSKEVMANQYGNLGNIYQTRGELEKASDVWGKSKSLFLAIGADHMAKKVQGWIDGLDSSEDIE